MTTICTGLWEIMNSKFWYQRTLGGGNKLRHYVITYIAITCTWRFDSLRLVSWTTTTTTTTKTTTTTTTIIVAGYLTFLDNQAGKYNPPKFIFLIGEEVNNEYFEAAELFAIYMLCVKPSWCTDWTEMGSDWYPAKLRGENYVTICCTARTWYYVTFGVQHLHDTM